MTLLELRRNLRKTCRSKTQKAYARELGVSLSYLNEVIGGRKIPGRKILGALGLERNVEFVPALRSPDRLGRDTGTGKGTSHT